MTKFEPSEPDSVTALRERVTTHLADFQRREDLAKQPRDDLAVTIRNIRRLHFDTAIRRADLANAPVMGHC